MACELSLRGRIEDKQGVSQPRSGLSGSGLEIFSFIVPTSCNNNLGTWEIEYLQFMVMVVVLKRYFGNSVLAVDGDGGGDE